jgi:hypothetical protein
MQKELRGNSIPHLRKVGLEMLGEIFEEVWVSVAARFSSGDHTEAARMRLAMIILDLAADKST